MDQYTALDTLGFNSEYRPRIDEIEAMYAKQLASVMKNEFENPGDNVIRENLDEARAILIGLASHRFAHAQPIQPQYGGAQLATTVQDTGQFYQKQQSDPSPIQMINVSDFSTQHRTHVNYLRCPFCAAEVSQGVLVCPACNNQVARNCPSCAAWISITSQSCPSCGIPVAVTAAMKFAQKDSQSQTLYQERQHLANYHQDVENRNQRFFINGTIIWLSLAIILLVIILITVL